MNTQESKFFEDNSTESYRKIKYENLHTNQDTIQDHAKDNLFQFDECENFKIRSYRTKPNNILNGWTEQFQYYNKKYKQLCLRQKQIKTHNNSKTKIKCIKTEGTQNLIPKLKELLMKLESPEKQKSPSNIQLFNIDLLNDLKQKRKPSLKVSQIIKNNENKFNYNSKRKQRLDTSIEPLRNLSNKINTNLITKTGEIFNCYQQLKLNQKAQLEMIKQNEVIRLIKKKRLQLKNKKTDKQSIQNQPLRKQIINYCSYKAKRRQKPTLTNLIKL